MAVWPNWWSWELDFTSHLQKRMLDRRFNETDLRSMLERAEIFSAGEEPGRFIVQTRHEGNKWEVVVEPLTDEELLLIVTAYSME